MVQILVLNKSNVVQGSNNSRYSYKFQGGGITLKKGDKIALSSIVIPYSVFNLTNLYNNNYFGYNFNGQYYKISIQDGYYDMTDLNIILQNYFFSNGHYRLQPDGIVWYPGQLQYNPNLYSVQFNAFVITQTIPSKWTNPANFNVNSDTTIQLVIPNTNIKNIFGFNPASYPTNPQSTNYQVVSQFTPNGSPLNTVILQCNLVDNKVCIPNDILYSYAPNVSFGVNQIEKATQYSWADCRVGQFTTLDIKFCDENFNNIVMQDNNICMLILLDIENN